MESRNHRYHTVCALGVLTLVVLLAPLARGSTSAILYDSDGFRYDVSTGSGTCLSEGTADSYDNAYYLKINGVNYNATNLSLSGRNIVGTTETVAGLRVTRKLYVPGSKDGSLGNFGRWYDTLYNPTGSTITVSVEYFCNLGSDGATQITGTDDDDRIIELSDQWVSTDDEVDGGGDSSLAHVIYVAGADEPIDYVAELKIDASKVNVNGGAIALGHPIGCSGARVLVTLIYAMRARGEALGIASLCIGGGQGIALAVELPS